MARSSSRILLRSTLLPRLGNMVEQANYSVLISNWNGEKLLPDCLRAVEAALRYARAHIPVTVIDDASADGSVALIRNQFPQIKRMELDRNIGYAQAVNVAMKSEKSPWVFLLNNDLVVSEDFFERMIEAHKNVDAANLFAVGAKTVDWKRNAPNHGGMNARWDGCLIAQAPFEADALSDTIFFQAGACLISRPKFLELGGFPEMYFPGYWEDYDLALRAVRSGWRNYYEPGAIGYHRGGESMRTLLGEKARARLIRRNHLLFSWIHCDGPSMLAQHFIRLPKRLAAGEAPIEKPGSDEPGGAGWAMAYLKALLKLPAVLKTRRQIKALGLAPPMVGPQ